MGELASKPAPYSRITLTTFATGSLQVPMSSAGSGLPTPAKQYTYHGLLFRKDQLKDFEYVGKGSFGDVHFATLTEDDGTVKDVAVKQFFPVAGIPEKLFRSKFMKESAVHMHLADGCACIAQLVGITEDESWQVLERLGLYEVSGF